MTARAAPACRVALVALAAGVSWAAAPLAAAPAPRGPAAPDHLTGPLANRLDSPVLLKAEPDGGETVYWLVFPTRDREQAAINGLGYGDTVTARGRIGTGGAYRYLAVESIEKD